MRCADRWNSGNGYRLNKRFWPAIARHGWNSFDSYVLALLDDRDALNRAEVDAIRAAGGHKSQFTFNLSPGGDLVAENDKPLIGLNLKTGEERRFKSGVEASIFIGSDRDGPSEIARSRSSRLRSVRNWWFRFEDDPDSVPPTEFGEIARLEQVRRRQGRPVVALHYETGASQSFPTIAEAAKSIGVNTAAIADIVAGIGQSACGWWFRYADDAQAKMPSIRGIAARAKKRSKRVFAVNLITKECRTFSSIAAAARVLSLKQGDISSAARGKRNNTQGWWFSYDLKAKPPTLFGRSALVRAVRSEPVTATILSTKERRHFPSAKAAAEAFGISRAAISKALRKKGVTGGIRFKRLQR